MKNSNLNRDCNRGFFRLVNWSTCGLRVITTTVVKYCTYIYKITKHRYLARRPVASVSDHRRLDLCPAVCPLWLVAKA